MINIKMHRAIKYQYNAETPEITRFIIINGSHLIGRLQCMPQHFRCSVVQSKARRSQAAIGWLQPRKAKIDQSDLSLVSLAFIQQVLQCVKFILNTTPTIIIVLAVPAANSKVTAMAATDTTIIIYLLPNSSTALTLLTG